VLRDRWLASDDPREGRSAFWLPVINGVWNKSPKHGFTIISKDSDFNNLAFLFGAPKVDWIQAGNCSTADIEMVLRARHANLLAFAGDH
jgi:predicted nuclease of predicted toxin-antitoxin system